MLLKLFCSSFLLASIVAAQPRVSEAGIVNAASYGSLSAPGAGIAQGAMIVIFGSGLGPSTLQRAPALPLTTELAGTRVRVGSQDAYLIYTSAGQVSAIVPSATPLGQADVTVTYNGQTSPARQVTIVAADFGLFTRNSGGYGPAIVQNFVSTTDTPLNGLVTTARPGQTVIAYGTGLGAITGGDNVAPGAQAATGEVQVVVGGRVITPTYAGRSPDFPALDQVNFALPSDVATGCYVPLTVRAGNRLSNTAAIAIRSGGGACEHPLGLSETLLREFDSGASKTFANLLLTKYNIAGLVAGEEATALFSQIDANGLFVQTGAVPGITGLPVSVNTTGVTIGSTGQCFITTFNPQDSTDAPDLPTNTAVRSLDAGSSIRLSGPNSRTGTLTRPAAGGAYAVTLSQSLLGGPAATVLQPGRWELTGTGGADVAAFSAAVELPALVGLSSPPASASRSQPLVVNWTGGGATDTVLIVGISSEGSLLNLLNSRTGTFVCTSQASARTFTVPASIVSQLPAGNGFLAIVNAGIGARPTIPLVRGGNVDVATFSYTTIDSASVRYQ